MINSISSTPSFMAKKVVLKGPEGKNTLEAFSQVLSENSSFSVVDKNFGNKKAPYGFTYNYIGSVGTPEKVIIAARQQKENAVQEAIVKTFGNDAKFKSLYNQEENASQINRFKDTISFL